MGTTHPPTHTPRQKGQCVVPKAQECDFVTTSCEATAHPFLVRQVKTSRMDPSTGNHRSTSTLTLISGACGYPSTPTPTFTIEDFTSTSPLWDHEALKNVAQLPHQCCLPFLLPPPKLLNAISVHFLLSCQRNNSCQQDTVPTTKTQLNILRSKHSNYFAIIAFIIVYIYKINMCYRHTKLFV